MGHSYRIGAIVLAAGRSSRMGSNKLLADVGGAPMVRHAVLAAVESRADPVIVVTGNKSADVAAALDGLTVRFRENPDYSKGLSTSLIQGLNGLPQDLDGVLVLLGDMPGVDAALLDRMIAAFDPGSGRAIVAASHGGQRGNPVLWAARFLDAMRGLSGDVGARALLEDHAGQVFGVEAGAASQMDIDTPAALEAWRAR